MEAKYGRTRYFRGRKLITSNQSQTGRIISASTSTFVRPDLLDLLCVGSLDFHAVFDALSEATRNLPCHIALYPHPVLAPAPDTNTSRTIWSVTIDIDGRIDANVTRRLILLVFLA